MIQGNNQLLFRIMASFVSVTLAMFFQYFEQLHTMENSESVLYNRLWFSVIITCDSFSSRTASESCDPVPWRNRSTFHDKNYDSVAWERCFSTMIRAVIQYYGQLCIQWGELWFSTMDSYVSVIWGDLIFSTMMEDFSVPWTAMIRFYDQSCDSVPWWEQWLSDEQIQYNKQLWVD